MKYAVPDHYFKTHFFTDDAISHWPIHFAIISAYTDTIAENLSEQHIADQVLHQNLIEHYSWVRRITAFEEYAENVKPCWAVNTGWESACDIAKELGQEAVYFVADNTLNISYSDDRRKPYPVGSFLERLTNPRVSSYLNTAFK